jgi:hypothetical protein
MKTIDAADRAHLIKALVLFTPPCFIMLGALWYFLSVKGVVAPEVALVLTVLSLPASVWGAFALNSTIGQGSRSFVNVVYAWGGSAPQAPSYPRQELLIARGEYAEAAEYFRDHIRINPQDLDARLRLASLLERHLRDDDGAERLYLDVRRLATDRNYEFAASNGLIDLYRRGGRAARLRVELGRFAERFRGSAEARHAARELMDLKAGDTAAES